jgi:hypothetical protein
MCTACSRVLPEKPPKSREARGAVTAACAPMPGSGRALGAFTRISPANSRVTRWFLCRSCSGRVRDTVGIVVRVVFVVSFVQRYAVCGRFPALTARLRCRAALTLRTCW